ncbi:OLC1v1033234C3 [Oldenlandia corymbosa var. corymbosa]|nr:OLC1v1033234C3 [Oldenlandia corymbosa var. corymbosa]
MAKLGSSSHAILAIFLVGLLGMEAAVLMVSSTCDYGIALDKTLQFFEAQRSGKLPPNRRVNWRFDSGLKDGFLQGVNLVGGYYDAGDHVKFGLPMAFAVTMMSWGAIEFRTQITNLNEMGNTLAAIKWGTDYFMKAHTQPNVLWGQVGDGVSDHYCWERAEDMTTPRTGYRLDSEHPGSDLAAETAAALAAASLAFKPYNSSYSNLLLIHAKQLFTFADSFRGIYHDSIPCAKQFYTSSGYFDELLWAAAWLYRATDNEYYLKYVVNNAVSMGGTGWAVKEFSWDNKYAGVQILLSKVLFEGRGGAYTATLKQYQAKADFFACANIQKNDGYNVQLTPGGLIYVREWNNLQYAASASFLLAVYSDYLSAAHLQLHCPEAQVQPQALLDFAKSQADYILGKNPRSLSYVVGFGQNYPTHIHHRGASIAPVSVLKAAVGCVEGFETWYRNARGNPNIIHGALVGGPNVYDGFNDDRSNYEQTEPTISGTAPLVGLFARLQSFCGNGNLGRSLPPRTISPNNNTRGLAHLPARPNFSNKTPDVPVSFLHLVTSSWTSGGKTFFRHKVVIKNVSPKPITDLKLRVDGLTGPIWGLGLTEQQNTYQLPPWLKVLKPGGDFTCVYVQGGVQAKITVLSYQ